MAAAALLFAGGWPARAALPSLPATQPVFGADIQVSLPVTANIFLEKNLSMAVNPTNPSNLLGAGTTSDLGGSSAYHYSTDAGLTWQGGLFTGPWGGSENLIPYGDSRVAFDARGTGYYSTMAIGNTNSAYYLVTTTNGITWGTPQPVIDSDYSTYRSQSSMAVDPRLSGPYAGSIYMAWIRTGNTNPYAQGVQFTYSRDGGRTWSPEIPVSDQGREFSYSPSISVAQDGTIYVAFEQLDNYYIGNPPKLYVDRSTDGGQTWGPDQSIAGASVIAIGRPDYKGRELMLIGGPTCYFLRINHFPSVTVSRLDSNTLYATWNDGRWEPAAQLCGTPGQHSDIAFSRSTDAGVTWSAPVRLNDDPLGNEVDQFQPVIEAGPNGLLGATWYDRRYDPNGYMYDSVYSQSTDGGATWSPNQRVSDLSSDPDNVPDYKSIDDVGSRHAMVYGPDYVEIGWFDTRSGPGNGLFYADHGVFAQATVSPTPTATSSSTPTHTPSPTVTSTIVHTFTPTVTVTGTPPHTFTPTSTSTLTSTASATLTPPSVTVTPTSTPTTCTVSFSDVNPGDYFYEAVSYLYCHGAVSGYADGTFRPYSNTTRGQLSKIVVLAEGWQIQTPTGTPTFRDVAAGSTFYDYIETAYAHQVISGYSCGTGCLEFKPFNNITRSQLTKVVVLGENWAITPPGEPTFRDVPVGDPFYGYVETAYAHQVISGYSCGTGCLEFRPGDNATRGQISKIVYNAVTAP